MLQPSSNLFPRLFGGCNPETRVATASDVFFTLYLPKLFKNTGECIFFWVYFSRVDAHVSYTLFQDGGCSSNTFWVMYFNIMTHVGRVLTLRIQVRSVKQRCSQGFPWWGLPGVSMVKLGRSQPYYKLCQGAWLQPPVAWGLLPGGYTCTAHSPTLTRGWEQVVKATLSPKLHTTLVFWPLFGVKTSRGSYMMGL